MQITMTGYHHNLTYEGITETVVISYSRNEGQNTFTGSVVLTNDDVETTLEECSKAELDPIAKAKIVEWVVGPVEPVEL